jgi:hypothetical protein
MLVTGAPPNFGGGGHAAAHLGQFALGSGVADDGRWMVWEHAGRRWQVADIAVYDPKQPADRFLFVVML